MSTAQRGVHDDLMSALLAAREAPASARFEVELSAAAGALDPDTEARLRLWHQAAVDEVADYVKAVLPAVLDAIATAREDARRKTEETALVAAALVVPKPHENKGEPAVARDDATGRRDTPETASAPPAPGPSSLEPQPSRMMVADLVVTRSTAHHEHS